MVGQRARRDDDKQARRDALLAAAEGLLASRRWATFSLSDLASKAGLSKPTVFSYYPTREALLLGLFAREFDAWHAALAEALGGGGPWSSSRVARAIAASVAGRVVFLRLLAQLEAVIERNVPEEHARAHKVHLGASLADLGARIEQRLPWLAEGEGVAVVLRARALVSGLWQMADASPVVDKLLREPALAPMRVHFDPELTACLDALLAGMERTAREAPSPRA